MRRTTRARSYRGRGRTRANSGARGRGAGGSRRWEEVQHRIIGAPAYKGEGGWRRLAPLTPPLSVVSQPRGLQPEESLRVRAATTPTTPASGYSRTSASSAMARSGWCTRPSSSRTRRRAPARHGERPQHLSCRSCTPATASLSAAPCAHADRFALAWQEVAIKKVLQDKRFKVRPSPHARVSSSDATPRTSAV